MSLLNQLKGDLSPDVTLNKDLSFTPTTHSLTENYRRQLKVIAESVDVNLNAILGMLTTDQLKQVVRNHQYIGWSEPHSNNLVFMDGITKHQNGKWYLSFDTNVYQLHELEIQECLGLLSTCENVLIP